MWRMTTTQTKKKNKQLTAIHDFVEDSLFSKPSRKAKSPPRLLQSISELRGGKLWQPTLFEFSKRTKDIADTWHLALIRGFGPEPFDREWMIFGLKIYFKFGRNCEFA